MPLFYYLRAYGVRRAVIQRFKCGTMNGRDRSIGSYIRGGEESHKVRAVKPGWCCEAGKAKHAHSASSTVHQAPHRKHLTDTANPPSPNPPLLKGAGAGCGGFFCRLAQLDAAPTECLLLTGHEPERIRNRGKLRLRGLPQRMPSAVPAQPRSWGPRARAGCPHGSRWWAGTVQRP